MPWYQMHAPRHQQAPRWLHLHMGPCIVLFSSFILSRSFNKQNKLKINDRNIEKGRRTQWFLWKYWVALTRNCNTPLQQTTDHGYHSNPCVVPHPVTLATVCVTVSMRTSDFHKGGSRYDRIPGCRLPVPIVSLKRYLVSGMQAFPDQIIHF